MYQGFWTVLVAGSIALSGPVVATPCELQAPLGFGQLQHASLARGECHRYAVDVPGDRVVELSLPGGELDVELRVSTVNGSPVLLVPARSSPRLTRRVVLAHPARVEVAAKRPQHRVAAYRIELAEPRVVRPSDDDLLRVQQAYTEAAGLMEGGERAGLETARERLRSVVAAARSSGRPEWEVRGLADLAMASFFLGDVDGAVALCEQIGEIARAQQYRRVEVDALVTQSNFLTLRDTEPDLRAARELIDRARGLSARYGDVFGELRSRLVLGHVLQAQRRAAEALEHYTWTLERADELGLPTLAAKSRLGVGLVYQRQRDFASSATHLEEAAERLRQLDETAEAGAALANLGFSYKYDGRLQKALDAYVAALDLLSTHGAAPTVATVHHNVASLYVTLGDPVRAREQFQRSLALRREAGHDAAVASTLSSLSRLAGNEGRADEALALAREANATAKRTGDSWVESWALQALGEAHLQAGDDAEALAVLDSALARFVERGDHHGTGTARLALGLLGLTTEDYESAIEHLGVATGLYPRGEPKYCRARGWLAQALLAAGRPEEAIVHARAAIDGIELLRERLDSATRRTSFALPYRAIYQVAMRILMELHDRQPDAGHLAEAFAVSERARARALLESLQEAGADIRQGVPVELLEQERALDASILQAADRLSVVARSRARTLEARAEKELGELLERRRVLRGRLRRASPRYSSLAHSTVVELDELRPLLTDGSLLIEYALGEEESFAFVVDVDSIEAYRLPRRRAVETLARRAYERVTARGRAVRFEMHDETQARIAAADRDYERILAELGEMLLAPMAHRLTTQRLLFVPEGALHYVPFAALRDPHGSRFLIERHDVVQLPSATTLASLRPRARGDRALTVAVLADPVFGPDDVRLQGHRAQARNGEPLWSEPLRRSWQAIGRTAGDGSLPRLPGTRREARAIVDLLPAGQGLARLDFDARREALGASELSAYGILHVATHGILNSAQPELSGLVLSLVDERGEPLNGFVRAHELYNLELGAETVVLSGCETGLGDVLRGEGVSALTSGFLYAGARRVIVTLWSIDDAATVELMSHLYGELRGEGDTATALRRAQLAMLRSERWSHPFYWAAFVLQGDG